MILLVTVTKARRTFTKSTDREQNIFEKKELQNRKRDRRSTVAQKKKFK